MMRSLPVRFAARDASPRLRALLTGLSVLILLTVLMAAGLLALCVGRYPIAPATVLKILVSHLLPLDADRIDLPARIVWLVRAPRVILAAACGAGLALGGAALQGMFRNPLVSPQILGVSSGAAFGGAIAIVFGLAGFALIGVSFACGCAALAIVGLLARVDGHSDTASVLLTGIVVGALFTALVSLVQFLANPDSSLPAIVFWLMGSFAATTWTRAATAGPALALGMMLLWLLRFRINVLSLGDDDARALGVAVERDRWLVFMAVALIEGATVSLAGLVGWVGLVVPHAARLLVGSDQRVLLPVSALLGASYLLLIDTLARSATSAEIPLGVLTAIVGAPFFALLLRRMLRRQMNP